MYRALLATALVVFCHNPLAVDNEYQGQQTRSLKALSEQEIDDIRQGKGMGLAKAAELNSYPGPRHVLDLADALMLSEAQRQQTELLFIQMQHNAKELGGQLIAKEHMLDTGFASQTIDQQSLNVLLQDIGLLQAQLRATHLAAHIEQRAILNEEQIQAYNQLRGYTDNLGNNSESNHPQYKHH